MKTLLSGIAQNGISLFEKLSRKNILGWLVMELRGKQLLKVGAVFNQPNAEQGVHCVRVHRSRIKSPKNPDGIFERDEMTTLVNESTGQFITVYVRGAGKDLKDMFPNVIAIDAATRYKLGIGKQSKNLDIGLYKASFFARHYSVSYEQGSIVEQTKSRTGVSWKPIELIIGALLGWLISSVSFSGGVPTCL